MSCVVCGEEGAYFAGTLTAERLVYLSRALWDLHRLRQTVSETSTVLADEVSDVIRRLEHVAELALDFDPNN